MNSRKTELDSSKKILDKAQVFQNIENDLSNALTRFLAIDDHTIFSINDNAGNILYANELYCQISKFDYDELIGANHSIVTPEFRQKPNFKKMNDALSSGQSWHGEIKGRAKDGSYFWCASTVVPIKDSEGKRSQFITISSDITEAKSLEEESRQRLINLEQAIESISDSFILYDADDKLIFCNQKHLDFFPHLEKFYKLGADRAEIWQRHANFLKKNDSVKNNDCYLAKRRQMKGKQRIDQERQLIDGRWVNTRERLLANGGMVAIRTDITDIKSMLLDLEKKSAQAIDMASALREAQDAQKDALDNITEGFVLWDENEKLVSCNARYKSIYQPIADIFIPGLFFEDFIRSAYKHNIYKPHSGDLEHEIQRRTRGHLDALPAFEEELSDGRWIRINQSKASNGRIVGTITDISEHIKAEKAIKTLAETDSLTGLSNRALFSKRLQSSLKDADRTGLSVGILLLDLDHFKMINDTMGHPVGDALLCEVANRLLECGRDTDIVARLGGDEFAIIASNIKTPHDIDILANRICRSLAQPYNLSGHQIHSSASMGITLFPSDDGDADILLRNADIALYKAKDAGRGGYKLFDNKMDQEVSSRRMIEHGLREAIEDNQLELYYQPQINVLTGKIIGVEALLRWTSPEFGAIQPNDFIPIAEATGLIIPICQWVLNTACQQAMEWQNQGLDAITMAVNISALQFKHQGLPGMIVEAIKRSGLDPKWLELEITEGVAMDNSSIGIFEKVKNLGVNMAIDDFGTGYSSLSQLVKFPVHRLKIDKSFIGSDENMAICTAIINLGASLNLGVIAEGVETQEELEALTKLGCHEMQGFLFSPAMPAPIMTEFQRAHNSNKHISNADYPALRVVY